ncbi:hypothetical protein [Tenacibaculum singaporense]|uniref:Uncharacterized protein n=1 Tax=Tenacibaculum singaporense TaxID=2358479 RepID=A0A3Q8RS55_9FLAO|nr:hypothetical protein [Tenacibaculum singaporense]AZJ35228.1 hypothetical protein D6T69_06715 [Tenacibaculum singaporense]
MKIKLIRISKNEWISFILTLIATLAGVLIAIWLTNSGIRNKEKEDTIKLLHTAKLILANTSEYSNNLNKTILKFEQDTVNYTKEKLESVKANNPIPYPDLLETIISNELISKNVSEYSHNSIYNNLINLRKLSQYETAEYYLKLLEEMMLNLDLEIEFQKDEIDVNELESKFELEKKLIENKYSTKNISVIKTD